MCVWMVFCFEPSRDEKREKLGREQRPTDQIDRWDRGLVVGVAGVCGSQSKAKSDMHLNQPRRAKWKVAWVGRKF